MATSINADNGAVSGSAGLKSSADSSGVLALQTNGTTAVSISTAQVVSFTNPITGALNGTIGATTPATGAFTTLSATGTISGTKNSTSQAVFSGWDVSGGASTQNGSIDLGTLAAAKGVIHYESSTLGIMRIDNTYDNANGVIQLRVRTAGTPVISAIFSNNGIGLGGNQASSGTGITFPATQSASSDANTLDDYEEGTWTPSVGGTATYNTTYTVGFYTKIGRQVTLNFSIQITSLGTGNATTIQNAPFACSSAINECAGSISYHDGLATAVVFIAPYIQGNTTQIGIVSKTAASTGVGYNNIFNTSSGRIWATLTYIIA